MAHSSSQDASSPSPTIPTTPDSMAVPDPSRSYRADAFRLSLPADTWTDQTIYTFSGPTVDGLTHRITITMDETDNATSAAAVAEDAVDTMTAHFDDCDLLLDTPLSLACDHPAHRTIFVRSADAYERLYQEQIHVLHDDTAYTLTASFTARSRKQVGRAIEDTMLSFRPVDDVPASARPEAG